MIVIKQVKSGICEIEMPEELANYWIKKDPKKYSLKSKKEELKKEIIEEPEEIKEEIKEKKSYSKRGY